MSKILISLIVIFFFLPLALASTLDFSYSEKVYQNQTGMDLNIWNDYGDIAKIGLSLTAGGQTLDFSNKAISQAKIDIMNLGNWGEFTHNFQVPNNTLNKKAILDFKANYNVSCNSKDFYYGDGYLQCGKLKINFNTLTTEVFTAQYNSTGGISKYDVKPQSYVLSNNSIKGSNLIISASLGSSYQADKSIVTSLTASDLIKLDPTYTLSNLSKGAVLNNVDCEGGGRYCHLAISDPSLVLYMPFDVNASNRTEYDWSSSNLDGRFNGNAHINSSGKYGWGLQLNGAGDWVDEDYSAKLTINETVTISVWVMGGPSSSKGLVSRNHYFNDLNSIGYTIATSSNAIWGAISNCSGGNGYRSISSNTIIFNSTPSWQHIVFVVNDTALELYLNGVQDATPVSRVSSHDICTETDMTLQIGNFRRSNTHSFFNGSIDEVMIFNKSLSPTEVLQLYNQQFPRFYAVGNMSLNLSSIGIGYSQTNITISSQNQQNSTGDNTNISLFIRDNSIGALLSPTYNVSNGTIQTFNTLGLSRVFNFTFILVPDYTSFFSPILKVNITVNPFAEYMYPIDDTSTNSVDWNGEGASIAIDSTGVVHIVSQDVRNGKVRYCNNTAGSWSCMNMTNAKTSTSTSYMTSVALDSNNKVHLVSYDGTPTDGRVYYCNNTASDGTWSCGNISNLGTYKPRYVSIAVDTNDKIHVANSGSDNTKIAWCNNTNADGVWACSNLIASLTTVDSTTIAIDSSNRIYIGGTSSTGAKYCNSSVNGASWKCNSTFLAQADHASLALDSTGNPHMAFTNNTAVLYCNKSVGVWNCDTLANAIAPLDTTIAIDSSNTIWIAYHENTVPTTLNICNKSTISTGWTCSVLNFIKEWSAGYGIGNPSDKWMAMKKGRIATSTTWDTNYHLAFQQMSNTSTSGVLWYETRAYTSGQADTTPPIITVIDPTNKNYTSLPIPFNVTTNEATGSCKYSFDNFITNISMTQISTTIYTATNTSIADGFYTVNFTCNDTSNNFNSTAYANFQVDTTYPTFSNYQDNNGTLTGSGVGIFNLTVEKTNTTVLLNINGAKVLASNYQYCNGGVGCNLFTSSATCIAGACTWITNFYNTTYTFSTAGTYPYNWSSWGNGTAANYNSSSYLYYSVLSQDLYNNVSQSLSLGQEKTPLLNKIKTFWDKINFFAWVKNLGLFDKSNSQGIIESSSVSKSKSILLWISDFFSLSSITTKFYEGFRNYAQKITLSSKNTQTMQTERETSQKISLSDSELKSNLISIFSSQGIDMSDFISQLSFKDMSVSQAIKLLDSVIEITSETTYAYSNYNSEAILFRDALINLKEANLTSAQLISLKELLSNFLALNKIANQIIDLSDSTTRNNLVSSFSSQGIDITELIYGSSIKDISVSQAINLLDFIIISLEEGAKSYSNYVSEAILLRDEIRNSKQANLTSSQIIRLNILRGYINYWCYQETANVSTACGGLNTGNYNMQGIWDQPSINGMDGNWVTYASTMTSNSNITVNYAKPIGALSSSLWEVRDFGGIFNLSIPTSCWDTNSEYLNFVIGSNSASTTWRCVNSTGTVLLRQDNSYYVIYEEAMIWNIQASPGSHMEADMSTSQVITLYPLILRLLNSDITISQRINIISYITNQHTADFALGQLVGYSDSLSKFRGTDVTINLQLSLFDALYNFKDAHIETSQAINLLSTVLGDFIIPQTFDYYNYNSEAIKLLADLRSSKEAYLTTAQMIKLTELLAKLMDSNLSVYQKIRLLELIQKTQYSNKWVSQAIDFSDFISRLQLQQNLQNERMILSSQILRQQNADRLVFQLIDFWDVLKRGGQNSLRVINEKFSLGLSDDAIAYLRSDVSNVIGWYTLGARGKEAYVMINQKISLGVFVTKVRDVSVRVYQKIIIGQTGLESTGIYKFVVTVLHLTPTISQDTSAPVVYIDVPKDGMYYGSSNLSLNVTFIDDGNISASWYRLDGGPIIYLTPNITLTHLGYEIWHTVSVYANDTSNNVGQAHSTFYIGTSEYVWLYGIFFVVFFLLIIVGEWKGNWIFKFLAGAFLLFVGVWTFIHGIPGETLSWFGVSDKDDWISYVSIILVGIGLAYALKSVYDNVWGDGEEYEEEGGDEDD
jgi:hypothetical protein